MSELKYLRNNNAICPHCDYENHDSWELDEDDVEVQCESCNEMFHIQIETERKYTTSKEEIY